ncbi:MAG: HNH endonuclease signature motif containing protein [Proteobacteria bacterium]|nr:HNH endonuclease signature motif containing protein [Pseudomonadota bacterium]
MLAAAGSVPTDAEIFMKAVGDLLTKRDPLRKAERAAARQRQNTAGRYIPAAVRHQVWLRDQGQCTHMHPDGSRCQEKMMIELDHIDLYCRGGEHSASNLQLKCRLHNNFAAAGALGNEWYRQRLEFVN